MITKLAVPLLIGIALIAVSAFLLLRREALVAYFVASMRLQVQQQAVGFQMAVAFGLTFMVMGGLLLSKGNKAGIILIAASLLFFVGSHFWGQLYLRQANWMATSSLWSNSQRLVIVASALVLIGVGLRFIMSVFFALKR